MPEVEPSQSAVAFLSRIGLPHESARKVARAGELLRQLAPVADPPGTEYAMVLDAITGEAAGREVRGSVVGEVEFAPLRAQMAPGGEYVVLHTHVLGSFSLDDARLFVTTPEIGALLAVARDGAWYAFTGSAGSTRAPTGTVDRLYLAEVNRLRRELGERILLGLLTEDEALAEIEHLIWEAISDSIGVRYDRSR